MLDLVRRCVERHYGRTTWVSLVSGPGALAAAPAVGRNGAEPGRSASTGSGHETGSAAPAPPRDAPSDALACWLGRQAVARIARGWPELLDRHADLRSFLLGLNGPTAGPAPHAWDGLAPQAKDGLAPQAKDGLAPQVEDGLALAVEVFEGVDADLVVTVEGEGACCALVEGLIAGAADHYGERARLELLKCRKRGDNRCIVRVALDVAGADAGFYLLPLSADEAAGPDARVV